MGEYTLQMQETDSQAPQSLLLVRPQHAGGMACPLAQNVVCMPNRIDRPGTTVMLSGSPSW